MKRSLVGFVSGVYICSVGDQQLQTFSVALPGCAVNGRLKISVFDGDISL
jgi:hypothetical protein